MPTPEFKIVWIMRRSDLHRAGSEFAVHHVVRDYRNFAIHQRQNQTLAYQMLVAFILGMNRNRRVAQHGLRTRRRDDNKFRIASDGIFDVPEMPLAFFVQYFEIAKGG